MKKLTAVVASSLMAIVAVRYCYLMVLGEVRPVLATWLLFSIATGIGIWTYLKSESGKKSLLTNILNATDVCATWSILIFLLLFGKNTRYEFTLFEIGCILTSVAILLYWKISKRSNVANVAINGLITIGYFPTMAWLWSSSTNTESFFVWGTTLISCMIAMYNPIKARDRLAILYASRAIILVGIVLGLMVRIEIM